jgi:hypothetical protein
MLTDTTYAHKDGTAPAVVVENDFYAVTLVPSMGGRILRWVDKSTGTELVYDAGYGGLLDDHDARFRLPYAAEWLKRGADEAVVRLAVEGEVRYAKTLVFSASRPVISVEYRIENHGQAPHRLLFRNVVRPAGTEFTGNEIYCYSRTSGLQRIKGMPRTDDQADPWCALVHVPGKLAVVNAFEGDILARLYTWDGSKVAPTYEFMFPQLEAGRQITARYTWSAVHGLSAVDYAHRAFAAQVEGSLQGDTLKVQLALAGTWAPMPDLKISAELLKADRSPLGALPAQPLPVAQLDTVVTLDLALPAPGAGDYAILLLKLESAVLGPDPIIVEKAFPAGGDPKKLAAYTRPVRWIGPPVAQTPIEGWQKEVAYVIQPAAADRARGYLVFDEYGESAGRHVEAIRFDVAQQEPEAFPLRIHSLDKTGRVAVRAETPAGMTLETFVPELVPETLWGRTMNGLKLNPGNEFEIKPGDDLPFYFRLKATTLPPGLHTATLTFSLPGAEPVAVRVEALVHPVVFPRHPFMVFDVNNVVNYLCARKLSAQEYAWDETQARNYLADMAAHGVAGQTINGVNAPNSHYWYRKVTVRGTGQPLTEAIKADPARFRDRLDLPALDFAEWDWFVDRLVEHGMTHARWPMGSPGSSFMQGHNPLTALIYGQTLPDGDKRQIAVQEWYLGEVTRYLKDRGLTRVRGTIGDEIPGEKLAWWVQHAYRTQQMGLEPGVTQSAETIADDLRMNLVAPFMQHWIVGTLHKPTLDRRRAQAIIKPEHWVTTYHSSANHWQPYAQMRGHCGLNPAYFGLDACWIQTYYRWNQSEAVIYPGETGPVSSAAWEGARDGLDDGNFLLLARAMIRALPDPAVRSRYEGQLEEIVGERETSRVRFEEKISGAGLVTSMVRHDTAMFRDAKKRLLDLVGELAGQAPVQKAAADFGLHPLIRDGVVQFTLPAGMTLAPQAARFFASAAAGLELAIPEPAAVDGQNPYPVFFAGTRAELETLLPALARHPDLADLDASYPRAGGHVVRFLRRVPDVKKKEIAAEMPVSMVVLGGDEAATERAMTALLNVVTPPRALYSHWLTAHRK